MAQPNKAKKSKYRRKDIHYALRRYEANGTASYIVTVQQLRADHPEIYGRLGIDLLQTWVYRYPKGTKRESLITINPNGYRAKADTYPEIRSDLQREIARRERSSLLRDKETLLVWARDRAEYYVKLGGVYGKYTDFKASNHWFYDVINEYNISRARVIGSSNVTWNEFVKARKPWLVAERSWLSSNNYVINGGVLITHCFNLDQVPLILKGKSRLQV